MTTLTLAMNVRRNIKNDEKIEINRQAGRPAA